MKPEHLKQLIESKREWTEPLSPADTEKGFKGWYASKQLPHFDSPGVQQFVTYRLADAMPVSRRTEWKAFLEIEDDLEKRRKIEAYLDSGRGECHLRDPRIAMMVQENLCHHDGQKYQLLAWVIMPNHAHVLIEVWEVPLGEIVQSWKSYTSKQANKILRRTGAFWGEDYFDTYIRDEKHCQVVVKYIEGNPVRAHLARVPEEWPWSSARNRNVKQ